VVEKFLTAIRQLGLIRAEQTTRALLEDLFRGIDFVDRRVLDVGGGDGITSFYAASRGASEVVCLEPEVAGSTEGVSGAFRTIQALFPSLPVQLLPHTIQAYEDASGFDVILLNASINHIDEDACIRLGEDVRARDAFRRVFLHLAALARPGAQLVIADCSRHNFFAALGLRNPFYPDIEWQKHQPPALWARLLADSGFAAPKISWRPLYRFGRFGRLFANGAAAFFFKSMFRLEMQRPRL
jgi:SAM-dependent methyltransferase